MSKNKILVVNDIADCGAKYSTPFHSWGQISNDPELIEKSPDSILCAVFCGGSDVDPSIYGHRKFPRTYSSPHRDIQEKKIFTKLKLLNIPLFGICRGAQFLCTMAGGGLVQHLDGHNSSHLIKLNDGREVYVNSIHHQMQLPPEDAEIIGVCSPKKSNSYVYDKEKYTKEIEEEYEIVYYPNIKALGVQYHPEIMDNNSDGWNYYQELIEKYLKKE